MIASASTPRSPDAPRSHQRFKFATVAIEITAPPRDRSAICDKITLDRPLLGGSSMIQPTVSVVANLLLSTSQVDAGHQPEPWIIDCEATFTGIAWVGAVGAPLGRARGGVCVWPSRVGAPRGLPSCRIARHARAALRVSATAGPMLPSVSANAKARSSVPAPLAQFLSGCSGATSQSRGHIRRDFFGSGRGLCFIVQERPDRRRDHVL